MHSNKNKEIVVLYTDNNVTINKMDRDNYVVRTKNGTYGFITCSDNKNELIVSVKKNKYETMGRFIHIKENDEQDIEIFIIEQTVNNIFYLVSKTHLHSIHKDFSPFLNNVTAENVKQFVVDEAENYEFSGLPRYKVIAEQHNGSIYNRVYYHVSFTRKKVVNNVFRYTQIFKNEDMRPLKKIHFYKAGDLTLAFGSFYDFVHSKNYSGFSKNIHNNIHNEHCYGVKGCLTDSVNAIKSWCEMRSIKVLKYKKYYVNVTFENGHHKLTYMENLTQTEFQKKKYNALQQSVNPNEYLQEAFLTVTAVIEDNKLVKSSTYDLDEIKHFEQLFVDKVYAKKKRLALLHPSYQLKDTVAELGLTVDELNLDILETIDMYTY